MVPAHPRQPTPRPREQLLCDYPQPLCMVEVDRAGAGDSHWVHSRPVRCVAGTVGQPRRCSNGVGVHDDWGWSDPGTLHGVPSLPLSWGRPLLAVSGSSRGWPACCRQVTPGKPGCGLPLRGHRGPGPVRASVLLSRVLVGAAVHLRGPAPSAARPTRNPKASLVSACRTRSVRLGVGSRHPRP